MYVEFEPTADTDIRDTQVRHKKVKIIFKKSQYPLPKLKIFISAPCELRFEKGLPIAAKNNYAGYVH